MNSPPPLLSFLPVRLQRERPFKSQLGCTAILAVVLLGVGAFGWFAGREPGHTGWVAYVVGGGFGFFGVLMVWALVRQWAAMGLRETVVELSTEPLQPGQPAKICLIQPGPAKLKSLRANLVCLEERRHSVRSSDSHMDRITEKMLHTQNLIDATHVQVAAGDIWHELQEFTVPTDARVAGTEGDVTIKWKIEVWGAGYTLASFMHPFPVDVYRGQRPVEDEEEEGA